MLSPVSLPNLIAPGPVHREGDRRQVVLVHRAAGIAEVAAGDRRHLAHKVIGERARVGPVGAGDDLHLGRRDAAGRLEQGLLRSGRAGLDDLQLEERRRADQALHLVGVADAGQLHQDLVAGRAVGGDDRLRDTERVDPALDGLEGLLDGLGPERLGDVRLQLERVAAGAAGAGVLGDQPRLRVGEGAERRVHGRRHAGDDDPRRPGHRDCRPGDVLLTQFQPEPLGGVLAGVLQGLVGLDAQHQLHAALEVEAQADPPAVTRRIEGRVDHRRGEDDHPDDREELPLEILHGWRTRRRPGAAAPRLALPRARPVRARPDPVPDSRRRRPSSPRR